MKFSRVAILALNLLFFASGLPAAQGASECLFGDWTPYAFAFPAASPQVEARLEELALVVMHPKLYSASTSHSQVVSSAVRNYLVSEGKGTVAEFAAADGFVQFVAKKGESEPSFALVAAYPGEKENGAIYSVNLAPAFAGKRAHRFTKVADVKDAQILNCTVY